MDEVENASQMSDPEDPPAIPEEITVKVLYDHNTKTSMATTRIRTPQLTIEVHPKKYQQQIRDELSVCTTWQSIESFLAQKYEAIVTPEDDADGPLLLTMKFTLPQS